MASADILFQQALAAIDLQNRERAQELLAELMENHPRKPEYWLALSYTLDEKEEKRYCIQQALVLDPDHELALKMLADLDAPPPPPEAPPLTCSRIRRTAAGCCWAAVCWWALSCWSGERSA